MNNVNNQSALYNFPRSSYRTPPNEPNFHGGNAELIENALNNTGKPPITWAPQRKYTFAE